MNLIENKIIQSFQKNRRISPFQRNAPYESDAEILFVDPHHLAVTTDTLSEEMERGFFKDPETIGYIAVVMGLSDLAAAGADPLGVLLSLSCSYDMDEAYIKKFTSGVNDALNKHGTFLLGGDTNDSKDFSVTTTAIGKCSGNMVKRTGVKEGDILLASEGCGLGNLVAFSNIMKLKGAEQIEEAYRPRVPFELSELIANSGGSCIDTSDGFFHTLEHFLSCNGVGAGIDYGNIPVSPLVRNVSREFNLPESSFLLSEVGDYGLIYSIPFENYEEFYIRAKKADISFHRVGEIISDQRVRVFIENNQREPDLKKLVSETSSHHINEDYISTILTYALKLEGRPAAEKFDILSGLTGTNIKDGLAKAVKEVSSFIPGGIAQEDKSEMLWNYLSGVKEKEIIGLFLKIAGSESLTTSQMYDGFAPYYDKAFNDRFHIKQSLELLDPDMRLSQVVDLGCGTGESVIPLIPLADKIFAIDSSEKMLEVARNKINQDKVKFILDSFLNEPDEEIRNSDLLLSIGVSRHVPLGREDAFFSFVSCSLKNKGYALISFITCSEDNTLSMIDKAVERWFQSKGISDRRFAESEIESHFRKEHLNILKIKRTSSKYLYQKLLYLVQKDV